MTTDFSDELLSAWIDDELAPEERQQVEQHLAHSESARHLVAELQTLRGEVSALPLIPIGDDFTDRVLKAALAAAHAEGLTLQPADVPAPANVLEPPPPPNAAKVEPTPASIGSTASLVVEPNFPGIILADAE